jgi:hypothetical protein
MRVTWDDGSFASTQVTRPDQAGRVLDPRSPGRQARIGRGAERPSSGAVARAMTPPMGVHALVPGVGLSLPSAGGLDTTTERRTTDIDRRWTEKRD